MTLSISEPFAALAPFRVRSFRFQWPADLLTAWAFEMENLILSWYVLVATNSVVMLTVFASLQFLGTLVAPLIGMAGDRFGLRTVLCSLRATYATLALVLMTLGLSGWLNPAWVFAVAAVSGLVRPADQVMRTALVGETMPGARLMSAMSLSRTTQDTARIVGALAGAALFAALGIGNAYMFVAGFYLLGLTLSFGVGRRRARSAATVTRASPWRELKDGLLYVWNAPKLLAMMWLAFLVNLTAFPACNSLLPYVARQIYGLDQTGLGYLVASFGIGALSGSLYMALSGWPRHPMRLVLVGTVAWHLLILLFGQVLTPALGMAVLMFVGVAQSVAMVAMAAALLRLTGAEFRGRVMGVRQLVVYGMSPGLLIAGWLIGLVGYSGTVTIYALFGIGVILLIGLRWRAALWHDIKPLAPPARAVPV